MLTIIAVGLCVAFVALVVAKNARPTRSIAHVLHDVEHPSEQS